jgi:hypothetical protein
MYKTGAIAWRLQIGSAFLPSLPLFFILRCPGRKMMEHLTSSAHRSQSLRVILLENVRPTTQDQDGGKKNLLEDHYGQH